LRTFKVKRVGMAGHIYYISLGEGELVGHVRTCDVCDVDLNAQPERYREIHSEKLPAAQLAPITNPDWRRNYVARLAVEKELASAFGKISAEDRQALIEEPFLLLAPKVEARFSASQFDGPTSLALVGLVLAVAGAVAVAGKVPESASGPVIALGWVIGIGLVVWQVMQIKHRYFRDKIFPTLVPALRPLKPTAAELEAVLKRMKQRGEKMGSKLDLKRLLAALKAPVGAKLAA
jgi:hypothetical protein